MRNLFYDLPDEILHLIYREYFRKYVLSINFPEWMGWYEEWNGYGIYGLSGEEANRYKYNFSVWNERHNCWDNYQDFELDWRLQNYGTPENPIQPDYKVWKLNRNIK